MAAVRFTAAGIFRFRAWNCCLTGRSTWTRKPPCAFRALGTFVPLNSDVKQHAIPASSPRRFTYSDLFARYCRCKFPAPRSWWAALCASCCFRRAGQSVRGPASGTPYACARTKTQRFHRLGDRPSGLLLGCRVPRYAMAPARLGRGCVLRRGPRASGWPISSRITHDFGQAGCTSCLTGRSTRTRNLTLRLRGLGCVPVTSNVTRHERDRSRQLEGALPRGQ